MAKIRLRLGDNEIEVDSRDFYVDNDRLPQIIETISQLLPQNQARITYENDTEAEQPKPQQPSQYGLEHLDDAEAFEPEFSEPKYVTSHEVKSKLRILETTGFFNSPRTVMEAVQQLREYGWAASSLDVSKVLAKMASNREIHKNSKENITQYFVQGQLIAS